ncbi:hypothetical protein [Brevundimonas goettingensis]|uniref:Uncharacterized protein n=1 Tax=Brevundimonas goettingensis TaxID=2774190 RepID=A0A975GUB9_9CAUL|nr:hypothetical protein [Brevundimonas goettingensis]QTC89667.1 hypothetical protein IFJ75_10075 [Brevundimonas goettingensis]
MTRLIESGMWRIPMWGGAVTVLLLPLIFHAPWTGFDYLVAGGMLAVAGALVELAMRAPGGLAYKGGALIAVAASVLLLWVCGAVGFLGDEGNPANLLFLGVIGAAVVGAVLGRFTPMGMARAMFAAAALQMLIGAVALPLGWASPGGAGLYEVALGTTVFTVLWLIAFGLFRMAAEAGR